MYCVEFCDRLRGKFGFFTEGNSEGFREQATKVFTVAEPYAKLSASPTVGVRRDGRPPLPIRAYSRYSRALTSPSRSFSGALRSAVGSERRPTWDRFSILATRECARQPPVRASPRFLSERPRKHRSKQFLMAIDISLLPGVFAGVHFPFGNTLIGLQFRRPSSSRPFPHR